MSEFVLALFLYSFFLYVIFTIIQFLLNQKCYFYTNPHNRIFNTNITNLQLIYGNYLIVIPLAIKIVISRTYPGGGHFTQCNAQNGEAFTQQIPRALQPIVHSPQETSSGGQSQEERKTPNLLISKVVKVSNYKELMM